MKILASISVLVGLLTAAGLLHAEPAVSLPLGSGNQVIAMDAATDRIPARNGAEGKPWWAVRMPA
jgi:hypothetical protein